jgi:anti-sigma factor RsiW
MKPDSIQLLAYVDGELSPQECQDIEREIAVSPDLAEIVAQLRSSRLPYQRAFAHQKLPPVPESLALKIAEMARAHAQRDPLNQPIQPSDANDGANDSAVQHDAAMPPSAPVRSRLRVAPAWLAAAFVAGAFFCSIALRYLPGTPAGPAATLAAAATGASPWVQAAASYQQLYSRDTIAPVPVDVNVSAKIVGEIRHDDGLALQIPNLSTAGLEFKRVQRLQFHNKPLVQIVYLPKTGAPIALCVMKEAKPDQAIGEQHLYGMNVVTWRRGELSYALIGQPAGVDLSSLAKRISGGGEQLFGDAGTSMLVSSL